MSQDCRRRTVVSGKYMRLVRADSLLGMGVGRGGALGVEGMHGGWGIGNTDD